MRAAVSLICRCTCCRRFPPNDLPGMRAFLTVVWNGTALSSSRVPTHRQRLREGQGLARADRFEELVDLLGDSHEGEEFCRRLNASSSRSARWCGLAHRHLPRSWR